MNYTFLQQYWWFLLSVLGSVLVFLLFVQGGQTVLINKLDPQRREMMIGSIAHRWELTFTTLVTFGGAFFASFPLFYSTSFGGAVWVWMLILLGFVLQAVSYKYRSCEGNLLGRKIYDFFLVLNGITAPLLLGGAVSTFFFAGSFSVDKSNLLDPASPIISSWDSSLQGIELLGDWRVVAFGLAVLFLSRLLANLWFINQIDDSEVKAFNRRQLLINSIIFVVLFLISIITILTTTGYETTGTNTFINVEYKYLNNLLAMPAALIALLIGTVAVVVSIIATLAKPTFHKGIWLGGAGTILVVMSLFWIAGYNNTPYYPSASDPTSSLTIYNSSSSPFTLQTMTYVSFAVPFVAAYIVWVWRKLSN